MLTEIKRLTRLHGAGLTSHTSPIFAPVFRLTDFCGKKKSFSWTFQLATYYCAYTSGVCRWPVCRSVCLSAAHENQQPDDEEEQLQRQQQQHLLTYYRGLFEGCVEACRTLSMFRLRDGNTISVIGVIQERGETLSSPRPGSLKRRKRGRELLSESMLDTHKE